MSTRILAAIFFATTLPSAPALAEWSGSSGTENIGHAESLGGATLTGGENTSRYTLHLKWTEDGDSGLLYAYSGKLYSGRSPYETHTQPDSSPVTGSTGYNGFTHEGQLISRRHWGNYRLDYVGGLGWNSWRHSSNQSDDYSVWFLRTGISLDHPMRAEGFHGGGGLKLPIKGNSNMNMDSADWKSSPQLSPGKSVNLYAELAYRTGNYWDIVGYFDSWRFQQSEAVNAVPGSNLYSIVQPQSDANTFGLKAMYSF